MGGFQSGVQDLEIRKQAYRYLGSVDMTRRRIMPIRRLK